MSPAQAMELVSHWCACQRWVSAVVAERPFLHVNALTDHATSGWQDMAEPDLLEAFAAHPLIGDVELLRRKYADTARAEQGQVLDADDEVISQLAQLNVAYKDKFGFIFIVFAANKSAAEMLAILQGRIDNSREQELKTAAREQEKIMLNRLQQTFDSRD